MLQVLTNVNIPSPPHPTQPKKLRSMRMCCKFSRTSTSPPHPAQPKKLRSMRMCCKFSRTSTSPPHPTQPKKLRSMRMCCKFSRTSTSPPHPTQPKKLRSMRMCCKFSRTSTSPPHPTQPKEVTFYKNPKNAGAVFTPLAKTRTFFWAVKPNNQGPSQLTWTIMLPGERIWPTIHKSYRKIYGKGIWWTHLEIDNRFVYDFDIWVHVFKSWTRYRIWTLMVLKVLQAGCRLLLLILRNNLVVN